MFRVAASSTSALAQRTGTVSAARGYYYHGYGCEGIWYKTMDILTRRIMYSIPLAWYLIYKVVFGRHNPGRQWIWGPRSELMESDGTEMEGEEAVANLRIHRERIMPIMNEYKARMEQAGVSDDF
jgi:hypothetical protein